MFPKTIQAQPPTGEGQYSGAQYDLVVQGAGFLSIVGAVTVMALLPFYPPTAQIGWIGWAIVVPASIAAAVLGALSVTLKHRPGMASINNGAFTGIAQVTLLLWLADGSAPYVQLLLLSTIGAAFSQAVSRCVIVLVLAALAALSPLLYSNIDVAMTLTELALLSVMTVMTATVIASTREHRERLKAAREHANVLAHVDPLTGMANRRAFDETLALAVESSKIDGTSISLLLCDVDSFKQINDTFGHAAGDEVLQAIAHALGDAVRRPDAAFRWAGDEFAVILCDSDTVGATRVAARLREAVRRQCRRPDGRQITIGTGVAELSSHMSAEEVLVEADRALFLHKTQRSRLRATA